MTKKLAAMALAASVLIGAGTPALAQPSGARLVSIGYSDLNLASDSGRATLQSRIDNAADRACATYGVVSLREIMHSAKCRDDFQAKADAQVTQRFAMASKRQAMTAASN